MVWERRLRGGGGGGVEIRMVRMAIKGWGGAVGGGGADSMKNRKMWVEKQLIKSLC